MTALTRPMTAGLLAVAMTGATGCLVKQTTHTIHLSPEGTVEWVVIEREIRSDEPDPAARAREEQAYLAAARLGTHVVAEAFALLGPSDVQAVIYRDERPFLVVTQARFERLDWLGRRVLERMGAPGESRLEAVPEGLRWTFVAGPEPPDDGSDDVEHSPLDALVEAADAYRVVLTEGRFVDAVGFTIVDRGTAAMLDQGTAEDADTDRIELSLTWTARQD